MTTHNEATEGMEPVLVLGADLADLIELGEMGGVEFKGPRAYSPPKPLKIVRAILGLANRRNGGWLVIGVDKAQSGPAEIAGMTVEAQSTWSEDAVANLVSEYGEPRPRVRVTAAEYQSKRLVVIRVDEFDEVPVVCKRDGTENDEYVLRRGAIYVRPPGKAETVEIPTEEDMRDLIERAVVRRLSRLLLGVEAAGGVIAVRGTHDAQSDSAFDEELGNF